jgi:pentatricopeptide repeat protein
MFSACVRSKRIKEAERAFKAMQDKGIIPNVQVCNWFGVYVRPVCTIDSSRHVYVCT